jgi:hypothetical protein
MLLLNCCQLTAATATTIATITALTANIAAEVLQPSPRFLRLARGIGAARRQGLAQLTVGRQE